ncbi:flagellin N-terminal helical domain-containing protein, partial [Fredinandcohnia onubensis]|uniref:flagellin N-terminal helical domain-containing protein n=1 Tax=Fredinandcohnia onubensis TaxID=1571209 RepID=UPI00211DE8A1
MISLIQTAEGALNETHSILQRMRELAVQSANDTNTSTDRKELQKEVDQLSQEISRIGNNTEFNTKNLLDGSFSGKFHIGANTGQDLSLDIDDMRANNLGVVSSAVLTLDSDGTESTIATHGLETGTYTAATDAVNGIASQKVLKDENGNIAAVFVTDGYYSVNDVQVNTGGDAIETVGSPEKLVTIGAAYADDDSIEVGGIDISTQPSANSAIETINNAIERVSEERSKLGAYQNRLDHTINNLGTSSENLTAA